MEPATTSGYPSSTASNASGETYSTYQDSQHSVHTLRRRPSAETTLSSPTSSLAPPAVPYNTPASRSVATESDDDGEAMDLDTANIKLRRVATALHIANPTTTTTNPAVPATPPSSSSSADTETKKRHDAESMMQGSTTGIHLTPAERKKLEDKLNLTLSTQHFHEYDTWSWLAEEDVAQGLKRLARAARDKHLCEPGKSVEEHYSVALAKVLKQAEIKFDVEKLA